MENSAGGGDADPRALKRGCYSTRHISTPSSFLEMPLTKKCLKYTSRVLTDYSMWATNRVAICYSLKFNSGATRIDQSRWPRVPLVRHRVRTAPCLLLEERGCALTPTWNKALEGYLLSTHSHFADLPPRADTRATTLDVLWGWCCAYAARRGGRKTGWLLLITDPT